MDSIIEIYEPTTIEVIPEEINPLQGVGIYPDVNEQIYRNYKAVNQSLLKNCERSLRHFKYYYDLIGQPHDDGEKSDVFLIGSAVHCAILEPEKFLATYIDTGVKNKTLKAYKEMVAAFPDKICLTKKEYAVCQGCIDSLATTNTARRLLEVESLNEVSAVWDHNEHVLSDDSIVRCKARADRYITLNGKPCIVDLKTTSDASTGFSKSIATYGYHVQAAFYLDGFQEITGERHDNFIIIALEKEPPYAIAVHQLDGEDIRAGRIIYKKFLYDVAKAFKTGEWDCYPDTIQSIRLPRWYYANKD